VESKGPHNQSGKDQPDDGATILRFPRDWFGPPEELVPFGPRAIVTSETSPGDAPPKADERPHRADAFWTEESATVHDAVEVAEPVAPAAATASSVPGRPPNVLIAVAVAALVVLTATLVLPGGGGHREPAGQTSAAAHIRTWAAVSRAPVSKHAARITKRARRHAAPAAAAGQTEPVVTQSTSAGSSAHPVPAVAQSAQAAPTSGSSDTAQSGGSSQPSASAASVQSSRQPAFGANGALGPGHSPDS